MIPLPRTDDELDELLSRPTAADIVAAARVAGDVVIAGCGGKMGPTLARLVRRALTEAGNPARVYGVSRFRRPASVDALRAAGVTVIRRDLLESDALASLPDAPNVILMAGHKFGSDAEPARTWAINVLLPAAIATRYAGARVVAFSTGNVYPLMPADGAGADESTPPAPIGEYAWSALARERVLTFLAAEGSSPLALLRLNYAVEPRYGVLRDIADAVRARRPVPLAMGHVNVIWQRDANAAALHALTHAAVPPLVLNVTGAETLSVRALATAFGRRFGVEPIFRDTEAATALLSDARRYHQWFGERTTTTDQLVDLIGGWIADGGSSLEKPTHFQERTGRF